MDRRSSQNKAPSRPSALWSFFNENFTWSVTFKFMFWALVGFYVIIYAVLFYRDYKEQVICQFESLETAANLKKQICQRDDLAKFGSAVLQNCHDAEHILNRDPYEQALYAVLEKRGFCSNGSSCSVIFTRVSGFSMIEWILLGVFIAFLAWLYAGWSIFPRAPSTAYGMPFILPTAGNFKAPTSVYDHFTNDDSHYGVGGGSQFKSKYN